MKTCSDQLRDSVTSLIDVLREVDTVMSEELVNEIMELADEVEDLL